MTGGSAERGVSGFVGHAAAGRIDALVSAHHRRRLRKLGWEHALDAEGDAWVGSASPATEGNRLEVFIDGTEYLPVVVGAIAGARAHVHVTGWYFSPEFDLTRSEEPCVLRNLLAEVAERADVRVLVWRGAPLPVFSPTRAEVRSMFKRLCRDNKVQCTVDSCVRILHCHHEKTVVVDDEVAFVGGIDLTYDGGDKFDSPAHPARARFGWHDAAVKVQGPAVAEVAEHFRMRWGQPAGETLPAVAVPAPVGDVAIQVVRTIPEKVYRSLPRGDFSILAAYSGALRSANRLVYLENQFLWSAEIVAILAEKLRNPPTPDFRVVILLPARANDGADVSRGQVAALIDADDGKGCFLACAIYARRGAMRDLIYVHSKIGIIDDRWLTIGSANLNEHSLFNDTEMNIVTRDERLARGTRLRLWAEHLELSIEEVSGDPARVVEEYWKPVADEQLERIRRGEPLTHRLVKLPGVSRRSYRFNGSLQGRLYDG